MYLITINHSVRENVLKRTGIMISTFEALSSYLSMINASYNYFHGNVFDLMGNIHSFAACSTEPIGMIYTINYSFETCST